MPKPKVLDWRKVTPETLHYGGVRQNKMGGQRIDVAWRDPQDGSIHPLIVNTPLMRLPFGISDTTSKEYGRKIEANLSWLNYQPEQQSGSDHIIMKWAEPETQAFYEWVEMLNEKNLEYVCEQASVIFGREISMLVLRELYKSCVKPSSDVMKYGPTLRTKIGVNKFSQNEVSTDFFNAKLAPVKLDQIMKGRKVAALLECNQIWFVSKTFGMNFQCLQMIQEDGEKLEGCVVRLPQQHVTFPPGSLHTPPDSDDQDCEPDQPDAKRYKPQ